MSLISDEKKSILNRYEYCYKNVELFVNFDGAYGLETILTGLLDDCLDLKDEIDKSMSFKGKKFSYSRIHILSAQTRYDAMSVDELKEYVISADTKEAS